MVVSLVRDDMHIYLGTVAIGIGVYQGKSDVVIIAVSGMVISVVSWFILRLPFATLDKRHYDITLSRYAASLFVWLSIGAIMYSLALCIGYKPHLDSHSDRLIFAITVATGVGFQPILGNFAAGLLLVLFRPFRVGDDISTCGQAFTVESITAFFTHGSTFTNVHVALPNVKVVEDVITNYTSNPSLMLELAVYVRVGRQPCSKVRQALKKAAAAFDAQLLGLCEELPIKNVKEVVAKLPKCEEHGVYGPMEMTDKGVKWMLKPHVPELAWLRCIDLGYECMHDALMDEGILVFEKLCSEADQQRITGQDSAGPQTQALRSRSGQ